MKQDRRQQDRIDPAEMRKIRGKTAVIKELVFLGFLVLMLFIGLLWFARPKVSTVEKRTLTQFPKLTLKGIWDGSFFFRDKTGPDDQPSGVSTWYADTYPLRELLIRGDQAVKTLYGKQSVQLISSGQVADEIPDDILTPEQLASLANEEPNPTTPHEIDTNPAPSESESQNPVETNHPVESETPPAETEAPTEPGSEAPAPSMIPVGGGDVTGPAEKAGDIYIINHSGYGIYYFNKSSSAKYILAMNKLAGALKGKANLYCMLCPISAGIMLSDETRESIGASDENEAMNWMYQQMDPSVKTVAVYNNLKAHNNEYIFFHTDHHWTALGAYYAYCQFCTEKGITPHNLSDFQTMTFPNFLGTFYSRSNQSPELKSNPDTVTAYIPNGTNKMIMYTSYGAKNGGYAKYDWRIVNDVSSYPKSELYGTFAGGDQPYNYAHNETITDGSSVLVVKDSYGNAFIPFLVDHYEHIYWIDYRYFKKWCSWAGKSYSWISGLVSEKGIRDVIICNNIDFVGSENLLGLMQ